MDLEKRARRQSFKVIISEMIMVITVIITVVILAFLVSGYWVGSGLKIERQGMLQIHSTPTGVNVAVDGDAPWYQRTNTSKVLSSGEHEIILTRDGYDTWSKTVSISEGLLYRIHYPRLFLLEREKSIEYEDIEANFATVSPDYNFVLLANSTTTWTLLNLNRDDIEETSVDVSKIFMSVSKADKAEAGLFTGKIITADWSSDNEHILFQVDDGETKEWVVLNVKNPKNSINITREFAASFDDIRISDNSASNLLGLRGGKLHKIDASGRHISAILAEDVESYDFYESEMVYISDNEAIYTKLNDDKIEIITKIDPESSTEIFISRFYDDKYISIVSDNKFTLFKQNGYEETFAGEISFIPDEFKVGHAGSFIFMRKDENVAIFDMEIMELREWQLDSIHYGWLDSNMLYSVTDGTLVVYDFDGLNRRELSHNVSARFPVTITNNRWLYYFSDDTLVREVIAR